MVGDHHKNRTHPFWIWKLLINEASVHLSIIPTLRHNLHSHSSSLYNELPFVHFLLPSSHTFMRDSDEAEAKSQSEQGSAAHLVVEWKWGFDQSKLPHAHKTHQPPPSWTWTERKWKEKRIMGIGDGENRVGSAWFRPDWIWAHLSKSGGAGIGGFSFLSVSSDDSRPWRALRTSQFPEQSTRPFQLESLGSDPMSMSSRLSPILFSRDFKTHKKCRLSRHDKYPPEFSWNFLS